MAILLKSFLRLSGRFERPAYPGFTIRGESSVCVRVDYDKDKGRDSLVIKIPVS